VIPGRAQPDDRPLDGELDRMVFGRVQAERAQSGRAQSERTVSEPDAPSRSRSKATPMDDDDAPPEHLFTERAPRERRKATRRKTDYVPLNDDAGQRAAEASKRGPLILVVTLVVIGVFGAVVWNAYSSGLRAPDGDPTPELASAGPFKSRPAVDTSKPADIDASVFERIERSPSPATTSEVRPEAVVEPKVETKAEPKVEPVKAEPVKVEPVKAEPAKLESVKVEPPKPAPVKVDTAAGAPIKLTPASTPVAAVAAPKPTAVAATPAAKPAKAPEAVAPATPALDGAFHPAFAATGAYVVQLAAPSTEEAAHAEWMRRAKAAPGLLSAAEKLVVKADVNGKTVYRLRAGSFATSADADAFCGAIKASGGACFVAKK
jgi:hypothetical protein